LGQGTEKEKLTFGEGGKADLEVRARELAGIER